jgi:glycosyltransferase involved in cell wall biosynthesis
LKLILVGSGLLEQELKKKAKNDSNIIFLPFQNQSQMPVVYRLSNFFCLPSQGPGETWGLAVNEAMASGLPVVVSNKVGCAIDLVDNSCGFVFESNNSLQLLAIFNQIANMTPELELEMKKASYAKIQKWSFETIVTALEKAILEKCIKTK